MIDPYLPGRNANLTVSVQKIDDVAYYELDGELDHQSAKILRDAVDWLTPGSCETVILDCRRLVFVSARGISALLEARAAVVERDATLALAYPSTMLSRILAATALTELLPIADSACLPR